MGLLELRYDEHLSWLTGKQTILVMGMGWVSGLLLSTEAGRLAVKEFRGGVGLLEF